MPPVIERRKQDEAAQATAGDRLTIQLIVWTVCATCLLLVMTMCKQAITTGDVSEPVDRNVGMVVAALVGWIGKTAHEHWRSRSNTDTPPPTAQEIGKAVTEAAQEQPVLTDMVDAEAEVHNRRRDDA